MRKQVLDFGYVRFVEAWGHGDQGEDMEAGIVEAARQSTQGAFRGWETDQKLLAFLYANKHSTPFEFAGMVIEVKAPIMVFREWHRHRIQSFWETQFADVLDDSAYNEMSARYAPLPDVNYVPTVERLLTNSKANKQAGVIKGADELTEDGAEYFQGRLKAAYAEQEAIYQEALQSGVPKELARLCLPVGRYSQMRACTSLRNWLAFLTLRMDPAAQWEIRMFASAVGEIIAERFPRTYSLFLDGKK